MNDWPTVKLSDAGTFLKGSGISRNEMGTGDLPAVRYGELYTDFDLYIKEAKTFISQVVADNSTPIKKNDILFAGTGETIEDIGKSAVFLLDSGYASGDILILRPNEGVSAKFVTFYLNSNDGAKQLRVFGQGQSVVHIHLKELESLTIPLPPLDVQEKIVARLEKWDAAVENVRGQIAAEEELMKGLSQRLLTGKTRVKGFSGAWETHKLADLFDFKNGYTPSKTNKAFWRGGTLPWFRMEDIRTNGRKLTDSIQHITPEAVKGKLFPKDSIIMSTTATIGEYAWLIADSLANQRFTFLVRKVNCYKLVNIEWFYYYCEILSRWCKRNVNSGGLLAVDIDAFQKYKISLPQPTEQKAIAKILSAQEQKITALREKLAQYESQKKYLLNRLLSGKEEI